MVKENSFIQNHKNLELIVGIDTYSASHLPGIGGIYKHNFKDFIVKEILANGKILEIKEDYPSPEFSEELKDVYTSFNLVKLNKDTFEAIRAIGSALRIPYEIINYSGLKDKCSISVQRASIRGNYIEKLKKLKIRDIFIRNISPSKKSVNLGSNWGNKFIITIRNIQKSTALKKNIEELFDFLNRKGFPNYYGLQRFGTFRPNSHKIGRFLLEGKYKDAFDEFVLETYPTESLEAQFFRNELKVTGNLKEAYNSFSKSLNYERTMIKHLIDHPNDYKGAIDRLPSDLIKLLISSFQSYFFNKMVSLRIKKGYSLFEPSKGDIISILDDDNGNITQIKYIYGDLYDKYLIEALKLNRAAIVVPLIGFDTNLDEFRLMKQFFDQIIEQENFNKEIFKSDQLVKFDFKGSFRAITIKPLGLRILDIAEDDLFPNRMKFKFEFSLQKGSYATILLREIIK
ncbi:MAG: tRNA pseudouridine(13) synthase TruD [Candidatus Heimdallarchaeota archaeon]